MHTWLKVADEFADVLDASGLNDPVGLLDASIGTVIRQGSRDATRRVDLDGMTVYVKQYRHGLRYLGRKSRARREYENLVRLRDAGLPVPDVLVAGERRVLGCATSSFIVTRELAGCESLEAALLGLLNEADSDARRSLIKALALVVRKMHRARFVHYDLHWRNILVRRLSGSDFEVWVFDCPRGTWPASAARRTRGGARDLACLDRAARKMLSRTDRLRFYLHYVGRDRLRREDRTTLTMIERYVHRMNRRHQRSRRRRMRAETFEVNPKFANALERANLLSFRALMDDTAADVFARHRRRSVARLSLADDDGPGTFYLKRFGPRHLKDDLAALMRLAAPESLAKTEWDALAQMRRAGFGVPESAAWGAQRRWGRAVRSLVLIAHVPGRALDELLEEKRLSPEETRKLAGELGMLVGRIHEAGFSYPDLYAKHVFVDFSGDETMLRLIDLQRVGLYPRLSSKLRTIDLAALNASVPPTLIGNSDRLRFLLAYLSRRRLLSGDRDFIRRILRRTALVVRRRHINGWGAFRSRRDGR